jgi:DNA-binding NarL/FixJ family response regulator
MVLADGSAIVRAGIKRMLAGTPQIEIVDEHTGAQAVIAAIRRLRPELVMLDFHLDSGSAVEVLQECRSMTPRPICIVHTADGKPSVRAISYAAGADVFYDKGREVEPLLAMLRKLAASAAAASRDCCHV